MLDPQLPAEFKPASLPDVAKETALVQLRPLEWVGMQNIEVPVRLKADGETLRVPAKVDAQVSLDRSPARGIHMSRLFLLVQEQLGSETLSVSVLRGLARSFLRTHESLSGSARVAVRFEMPVLRKALKSEHRAWRTYPVEWSFENRDGREAFSVEVLVTYSSTCPASAALSRQLIQENFRTHFAGAELDFNDVHQWLGSPEGLLATPHAQRSFAKVKVQLAADAEVSPMSLAEFSAIKLIDAVEDALQTPVQAAVKREDEQEFALRNGRNLMFCEDAARRVADRLEKEAGILDFTAELNHVESLHPHNAVAIVRKRR